MTDKHYDLFVIGAGSGGVRAARIAAGLGAKVGIAEERYFGGTCVNVGCVPKKLFSYAAHHSEDHAESVAFGWQNPSEPVLNWDRLRDNKTQEIERLNGIYQRMLDNAGVEIHRGRARLAGPNQVSINGETVSAKHILLAVGGWPWVPDIAGKELVVDSNDMFYLPELPKRAVVVGGGYIACEFASILNGLGVATTQLYRRDLFLRGFDTELREHLAVEMKQRGVDLQFNTDVEAIEETETGARRVSLNNGDVIETDLVMYATGRRPMLKDLGLEQLPVELDDRGYIAVDDHYQTSVPGIYALGDVIGRIELTPVALAEGMHLAKHLFEREQPPVDYQNIATAIFTLPNAATVGYSEEAARDAGLDIEVYTTRFRHMKHSLGDNQSKVFMKLLVDRSNDKVVGAHMIGDDAGELIQGIAIAVKAGATKADFDSTIGIHPTAAEEFVTMRTPRDA